MKILLKLKTIVLTMLLSACSGSTSTDDQKPLSRDSILSPLIPLDMPIAIKDTLVNSEPQGNHDWLAIARWQGPQNLTFKQLAMDYYQSNIDTRTIPFRSVTGGGPHNIIAYTRTTDSQPITQGVKFTWKQTIREFWTESLGIAQLSLVLYIKSNNNEILAMVINGYESRPELRDYTPFVDSDTYTMFFSSPVKTSQFMTADRQWITGTTGLEEIQISMTAENFTNILKFAQDRGTKISSLDLKNWHITHLGILHEIFRNNDPAVNLQSTVEFSTVKVTKLTEN